jgi:hypothetical protein
MNKIKMMTLVVLSFIGVSQINAQQVFKTTPTSVIPYLEYLPQDYNQNSNKYPIVLFMHGVGEKGPDSTDPAVLQAAIMNVAKNGPPKLVQAGTQFPFILISPQLKSSYSTWPSSYLLEVLNYCKTYLRIDERRIYVTGLSLGGGGAWVAVQDHPELFAAAAPVCGGYNSPSKACGIANENLPVWAFHGDLDTTVPLSRSQTMVNAINACVPTPSPLAKLTIYTGVAHNAWDKAYRNDNTIHNPNVYQWMLSYTNIYNAGNAIPVANAGADKTTTASTLTLTGSGTDASGSIASYAWTKLTGPSVTITNQTSASALLTNLVVGDYVFQMKATDNSGNKDSDYVRVSVLPNKAPVANAGNDDTITLPMSGATLSGSGIDSDGAIASYQWTKVSGGTVTIVASSAAASAVNGLVQGDYVFKLTVTDNNGASASDEVKVIVNPPVIPIVNAGADKLVKLPTTTAALTGLASDTGGTIVSYQWTKLSGKACTMTNTTSSTLKLSGLSSGQYSFRLAATDNDGYTASDDITVTVDAPPVVNAGSDITITLPMSASLILNGSATDIDGTIVKYVWSKFSGPNVVVENSNTSALTITKLYEGTYVFKLAVNDELGTQGIDYVTVVVLPAATGSARMATETAAVTERMNNLDRDKEISITRDDIMHDEIVVMFNSNGQQIYRGPWSDHSTALKENGLYLYNVVGKGTTIRSGRIYRRDI